MKRKRIEQFLETIAEELAAAEHKHANFCSGAISPYGTITWEESEKRIKMRNDFDGENCTADNILMEEVAEAFNAWSRNDKKQALTEFAQVAAVAMRCMNLICDEMERE